MEFVPTLYADTNHHNVAGEIPFYPPTTPLRVTSQDERGVVGCEVYRHNYGKCVSITSAEYKNKQANTSQKGNDTQWTCLPLYPHWFFMPSLNRIIFALSKMLRTKMRKLGNLTIHSVNHHSVGRSSHRRHSGRFFTQVHLLQQM